jgi:hypothetical protein
MSFTQTGPVAGIINKFRGLRRVPARYGLEPACRREWPHQHSAENPTRPDVIIAHQTRRSRGDLLSDSGQPRSKTHLLIQAKLNDLRPRILMRQHPLPSPPPPSPRPRGVGLVWRFRNAFSRKLRKLLAYMVALCVVWAALALFTPGRLVGIHEIVQQSDLYASIFERPLKYCSANDIRDGEWYPGEDYQDMAAIFDRYGLRVSCLSRW